ncbi:cytochrome P450 [Streptomyces shenzhenensis]|uniref:cytochrome P450 family protein n=1 Tax=Streptomyces TaxID=1883 RepID=UPI001F158CA2|nr:cytochrome P450 [Streptomyces shenzhenensis]
MQESQVTEELDVSFVQTPHEVLKRLREAGPAVKVMLPNGSLVWIVTRYEEVRQALSETKLSKDFKGLNELMAKHTKEGHAPKQYDEALVGHMLASDPPDHTRMRRLVNKAFTPRRVEGMRPMLRELTARLLDEMAEHDEIDLLEALAYPVPMEVLCTLLGVPEAERLAFGRYAAVVLSDLAPEGYEEATRAMREYLVKLIQVKRENPGDDLLSALIAARDEDDKLTEGELLATIYLMFSAGTETAVNLIGNGVLALLTHPGELEKLRADRSLLPQAVEEFLRFDGPVNLATFRYTIAPVSLGDVTIPVGEVVMVSLMAANRDPDRFDNPELFDITRPIGGQMTFGHGIHYCMGAPLARLEAEIALGMLLDRFPDLSLACDPNELQWRLSTVTHGLEKLPVRPHGTDG